MEWRKAALEIRTDSKGLHDFTDLVQRCIVGWNVQEGMCFLYIPHTSASLVMSENYDPTARQDLETFMDRQVPEDETWYAHRLEGADDSPAHIRSMLTHTSLSIPIDEGRLSLGTWQGIYLFEHRAQGQRRKILVRCLKIA